jgi:hypothetical protein
MKKNILIGLAILTVSTSTALAAHPTHHRHAMKPNASAAATNPNANIFGGGGGAAPTIWPGGVSASDHAMYIKNLRDSGVKQ